MRPDFSLALSGLTTMRLTRLVVSDDLGTWWIRDPLDHAWHNASPAVQKHIPHRYLGGLTCPWCVSFHAAWITLAIDWATEDTRFHRPWMLVKTALAFSEITANVGLRLGDYGYAD